MESVHRVTSTVNCKYCGGSFQKENLDEHIKNVHADKKFMCASCNKGFASNQKRKQHKCEVSQVYDYFDVTFYER